MRYTKYIDEHNVQFPPLSKIVNGKMVIGYANRTDLLEADGYLPYIEPNSNPPDGMVVDDFHYETDGSTIRKVYDYIPKISQDAIDTTEAIINRIAALVVAYDAIEDVKVMETINIESLLALADAKGVTTEDMALLKEDIVLLKTDLEGKMDANWYQIWNYWLKGAIAEALKSMEEALRRSQAENEANPQDD